MTAAFYLLLVIGNLGAFDVVYFHTWRCKLAQRPESHREVFWHTVRHSIYAMQFLWVANLRFHGWAIAFVGALYAADVVVAWSDVWEETGSRKAQGGLPRGEYFMHIVLSVLVGIYMACVAQAIWADRLLPSAVVFQPPPVPWVLRALMTVMGMTAVVVFIHDSLRWVRTDRRRALAVQTGA
ncbi:MAG TPA: hypothetical protein VH208_01535 [Myxococcaceae bacterium]|nr:hypothetical protein [Myxococcaceae bacterium]